MSILAAKIISVGDELFKGTINTTATIMARELSSMGVTITKIVAIGDNQDDIVHEVRATFTNKEHILVITGGLGSTVDDATVTAVAEAFQVPVIRDSTHERFLKKTYRSRNLPSQFFKQAEIPQGFTAESSPFGSAPFIYSLTRKINKNRPLCVSLLPGVPFECLGLFEERVIPLVNSVNLLINKYKQKKKGKYQEQLLAHQELKIIAVPETIVEEKLNVILRELRFKKMYEMDKRKVFNSFKVAFLPDSGELLVRFSAPNPELLKDIVRKLKYSFPEKSSYSGRVNQVVPSVVEKLHRFFIRHNLRVGFIESCTGGLLASSFVSLAGSSNYLDAGIVSYSNEAKTHFVGVPRQTIITHGAVSKETAIAMARGLIKKRKLSLAVAITGIAGPSGGNKTKLVGLVYIAICYAPLVNHIPSVYTNTENKNNQGNKKNTTNSIYETTVKLNLGTLGIGQTRKSKRQLYDLRNQIRKRAVKEALFLMLKIVMKKDK